MVSSTHTHNVNGLMWQLCVATIEWVSLATAHLNTYRLTCCLFEVCVATLLAVEDLYGDGQCHNDGTEDHYHCNHNVEGHLQCAGLWLRYHRYGGGCWYRSVVRVRRVCRAIVSISSCTISVSSVSSVSSGSSGWLLSDCIISDNTGTTDICSSQWLV